MKPECEILPASEKGLEIAAGMLRRGETVSIPTETVYGLAANALDDAASRRIFEIKGRPLIDPLIVHLTGLEAASAFAVVNPAAEALAAAFWPGPLTLILEKTRAIPDLITAGLTSVAIRAPAHPLAQRLLQRLEFPLAAPSANPFGCLSPTLPGHVAASLGHRISAILDGGPCHHGLESTIVDLRDPSRPTLLRPGPIDPAALEAVLRRPVFNPSLDRQSDALPQAAPGMLSKHYSPRAKLLLLPHGQTGGTARQKNTRAATVFNRRPSTGLNQEGTYWLSEDGSPQECARNLFALLHRLDQTGISEIAVELAEEAGIGRAINDRLRRAAVPEAKP